MKRREFIPSFGGALLGSAAIACPRAASAQQKFKIGLLVAGADMNMAFFSEPFISKLAEFWLCGRKKFKRGTQICRRQYRAAEGIRGGPRSAKRQCYCNGRDTRRVRRKGNHDDNSNRPWRHERPGRNGFGGEPCPTRRDITGNSVMAPELSAKRLDILRTLSPRITRFAILWDSSNPGMAHRVRETEIAADQSHVLLRAVGPRNADELDAAFADLLKQRPDALFSDDRSFHATLSSAHP